MIKSVWAREETSLLLLLGTHPFSLRRGNNKVNKKCCKLREESHG